MCCSQAKVELHGNKGKQTIIAGGLSVNMEYLQLCDRVAKEDNLISGMTFCLKNVMTE